MTEINMTVGKYLRKAGIDANSDFLAQAAPRLAQATMESEVAHQIAGRSTSTCRCAKHSAMGSGRGTGRRAQALAGFSERASLDRRRIPWKFEKFLAYAAKIHLLRRVGGGFEFIDQELQAHF